MTEKELRDIIFKDRYEIPAGTQIKLPDGTIGILRHRAEFKVVEDESIIPDSFVRGMEDFNSGETTEIHE